MTTAEILKNAKALLTPETWGDVPGPSCAWLAICRVADPRRPSRDYTARVAAEQALVAVLPPEPKATSDSDYIMRWNDAPGRTLAEVHDAFDRAIQLETTATGTPDVDLSPVLDATESKDKGETR